MAPEPRIDEQIATRMVEDGSTVRDLAHRFQVSTQAIYIAIRKGRIPAPATARLGDSSNASSADSTTPQTAA